MHGLILLFQNICYRIHCNNSHVHKSKDLIQQKKITFLSNNYLTGKINTVENIDILFFLSFFSLPPGTETAFAGLRACSAVAKSAASRKIGGRRNDAFSLIN